jgi:hypothetical protein
MYVVEEFNKNVKIEKGDEWYQIYKRIKQVTESLYADEDAFVKEYLDLLPTSDSWESSCFSHNNITPSCFLQIEDAFPQIEEQKKETEEEDPYAEDDCSIEDDFCNDDEKL